MFLRDISGFLGFYFMFSPVERAVLRVKNTCAVGTGKFTAVYGDCRAVAGAIAGNTVIITTDF